MYNAAAIKFGIRVVTAMNIMNSLDPHALSRYLPPRNMVTPPIAIVMIFRSAKLAVKYTHGWEIEYWGVNVIHEAMTTDELS